MAADTKRDYSIVVMTDVKMTVYRYVCTHQEARDALKSDVLRINSSSPVGVYLYGPLGLVLSWLPGEGYQEGPFGKLAEI